MYNNPFMRPPTSNTILWVYQASISKIKVKIRYKKLTIHNVMYNTYYKKKTQVQVKFTLFNVLYSINYELLMIQSVSLPRFLLSQRFIFIHNYKNTLWCVNMCENLPEKCTQVACLRMHVYLYLCMHVANCHYMCITIQISTLPDA